MWAEALYGCDAEENRRLAAAVISRQSLHMTDLLCNLLSLPWDCILTTNYSYEIENALTGGRWSTVKTMRKRSLRCADGKSHRRDNLNIFYEVKTTDNRIIPVWHVHGDYDRHTSMILTYYSYAKQIGGLLDYNKNRSNDLETAALENRCVEMKSWLDWYVLGEVYSVGFAFDLSEFDLWWATERKTREHAPHGTLRFYVEKERANAPASIMMDSIIDKPIAFPVNGSYESFYRLVLNDIQERMRDSEKP